MFEPTPRWRLLLVPPQWFRAILAFGPIAIQTIRFGRAGACTTAKTLGRFTGDGGAH